MPSRRTLVVEADGGSRGNPGPAAYGGVVRDGRSGEVLATFAEPVGVATNNVAEYHGLITGLRRAREIDPDAQVEARLDSRLVVEQMSGRWKIKHPDMRALALQARQAFPPEQVSYVWVPREQNALADRLLNEALDAARHGRRPDNPTSGSGVTSNPAAGPSAPSRGWSPQAGEATTLLLARHGETALTMQKRFSGVRGDPELTEHGREQAGLLGHALARHGGVEVVVSSTLRRARESAEIAADALGLEVVEDEGWRETDFGEWDGFTFAEIARRWPDELTAWLDSPGVPPPGGESLEQVSSRVRAARERLVERHLGRTVLVLTHVTPVKAVVCDALGAPLSALYRMELGSAALSSVAWYSDGNASLRSFNGTAHLDAAPPTGRRR